MEKSKWIFLKDYTVSSFNPPNQVARFATTTRTFKKDEVVEGENFMPLGGMTYTVVDGKYRIPISEFSIDAEIRCIKAPCQSSAKIPSPIKPYTGEETITDKVKSVVPKNHKMVFAAIVGLGIAVYYFNKISS